MHSVLQRVRLILGARLMAVSARVVLCALVMVCAPIVQPAGAQDSTARRVDTTAARHGIMMDRIVAVVGTKVITYSELIAEIQDEVARREAQKLPPLPSDSSRVMRAMLDGMINQLLIVEKANGLKITVPDEELTAVVEESMKRARSQFKTDEEFREALRNAGMSKPEDLRRRFMEDARRAKLRDIAIDTLRHKGKIPTVSISEREIQQYWDSVKTELPDRGLRVTWRQIIMRVQPSDSAHDRSRALADSLLALLKAGANFDSLARQFSDDSVTGAKGGDLDWFRRGAMVPEFEKWAFGLRVGEMSPVFRSPHGYHIVRVDRVRPGEVRARHILIMPRANAEDLKRAHATMDSVAAAIRAGASFDSLARLYNDEPTEDRLFGDINASYADFEGLPPSYKTAMEGLHPGDVSAVFELPAPGGGLPKVALVQLLKRVEPGRPTLDENRENIRAMLQNRATERRLYEMLRREIYVDIRLEPKTSSGTL
jgi:peptidyl-prolyl cis-trans isomerase SurA